MVVYIGHERPKPEDEGTGAARRSRVGSRAPMLILIYCFSSTDVCDVIPRSGLRTHLLNQLIM